MMCPRCSSENLKVLDTRSTNEYITRRRMCLNGHKFLTKEYAIPEAQVREKPETPQVSSATLLSKLWHGQWRSGGSQ
jgi:transcriptional regulator NrdR family protein